MYKTFYIMKIKDILLQVWWIIWTLPAVIVALFMMPFLGKLRLVRYQNYCWAFEGEKMSGGISLGCFIFLSKYSAKKESTIRHEFGHVVQAHILGPLYLLVIGLPSILNAAFNFTQCYHDFYPEAWANKIAGLETVYGKYGCSIVVPDEK